MHQLVDQPLKPSGTDSIMIGDTTTGTIDAANYNTGLGVDVFEALTSGDDNVAVGYNALTANTTGSKNTSVGNKCFTNQTLLVKLVSPQLVRTALSLNTTAN